MLGKKGMKKYPNNIKVEIIEKHENGQAVRNLSKEYGISRYAIQMWCGLIKGKELAIPTRKGRPR